MSRLDITKIENSKIVVIDINVNDTNIYSQNIFIEFIPDEVIVKHISGFLIKTANTPQLSSISISSDLIIYQPILASFVMHPILVSTDALQQYMNYFNSILDVSYKIPNFSNRIYNFTLTASSTLDWATTQSEFTITLEFIKYKKSEVKI